MQAIIFQQNRLWLASLAGVTHPLFRGQQRDSVAVLLAYLQGTFLDDVSRRVVVAARLQWKILI